MAQQPKLPLPESVHAAVWKAVVKQLKTTSPLADVVRTWRTWEGDDPDRDTEEEPTVAEMPWVRLTPRGEDMDWVTVGQTKAHLDITVEIALAGTRLTDSMDVFGAILSVLFKGDQAFLQTLQQKGCYGYGVGRPNYGPASSDGVACQKGEGLIRLYIDLTTQP